MFKMSRRLAVRCDYGPAIRKNTNIGAAHVNHRFDGEDHAGLQAGARASFSVVGDLGFFVQFPPDPVPDKFADDRVTVFLDMLLNGRANVVQTISGPSLIDPLMQSFFGALQELLYFWFDHSDRNGGGSVADPSIQNNTNIEFDDIAIVQLAGTANSMNDFFIDRNTDIARKPAISQKSAFPSAFADEIGGELIQCPSGHPRSNPRNDLFQDPTDDAATAAHL